MDSRERFKRRLMRQIDDRMMNISQLNRKMTELVASDCPDSEITKANEEIRKYLAEKRELESIFIGFDTGDSSQRRYYYKEKYKNLKIFD